MELDSLQKLFESELRDILSAEKQILKVLPRMIKAATSAPLQDAFKAHLAETKGQVVRLEKVFELIGKPARAKLCKAMQGLVEEASELLEEDADPAVLDAGLVASAQRVEHYEIAGYGTLGAYARRLGHDEAAALLKQTLDEESATDKKLSALAEAIINPEAV